MMKRGQITINGVEVGWSFHISNGVGLATPSEQYAIVSHH